MKDFDSIERKKNHCSRVPVQERCGACGCAD